MTSIQPVPANDDIACPQCHGNGDLPEPNQPNGARFVCPQCSGEGEISPDAPRVGTTYWWSDPAAVEGPESDGSKYVRVTSVCGEVVSCAGLDGSNVECFATELTEK